MHYSRAGDDNTCNTLLMQHTNGVTVPMATRVQHQLAMVRASPTELMIVTMITAHRPPQPPFSAVHTRLSMTTATACTYHEHKASHYAHSYTLGRLLFTTWHKTTHHEANQYNILPYQTRQHCTLYRCATWHHTKQDNTPTPHDDNIHHTAYGMR